MQERPKQAGKPGEKVTWQWQCMAGWQQQCTCELRRRRMRIGGAAVDGAVAKGACAVLPSSGGSAQNHERGLTDGDATAPSVHVHLKHGGLVLLPPGAISTTLLGTVKHTSPPGESSTPSCKSSAQTMQVSRTPGRSRPRPDRPQCTAAPHRTSAALSNRGADPPQPEATPRNTHTPRGRKPGIMSTTHAAAGK